MNSRRAKTFPVTVTQMAFVRCALCDQAIAHRAGQASAALTTHYEQTHAETVGRPVQS